MHVIFEAKLRSNGIYAIICDLGLLVLVQPKETGGG